MLLVESGMAYDTVMEMVWPEAEGFALCIARMRREQRLERLMDMAVAARVAQADGKDWKKWVNQVEKER